MAHRVAEKENPCKAPVWVLGVRRFGGGKEGGWGPQVVVALAVSPEGLSVRSWVFPGNTADVTTVERVKAGLRGWDLGRAIFVADSAMNFEENRDTLARACGYKGLMVIERSLRALKKTRTKMSPLYHWAPRRIEAHVKICVLALLMERLAEIRSGRSGVLRLSAAEDVGVSWIARGG